MGLDSTSRCVLTFFARAGACCHGSVRLAREGPGLLWALLRVLAQGRRHRRIPAARSVGTRVSGTVWGSGEQEGGAGVTNARPRWALGPAARGPGALGRNRSAGSGRSAERGAPTLSPRPGPGRGPADDPRALRRPETPRAGPQLQLVVPAWAGLLTEPTRGP